MDAYFEKAHAFTAKWEGGYVNHPSDPGGATNYGISLRYLQDIGEDVNGDGKVDAHDIRALSPGQARAVYFRDFWGAPGIYRLPGVVAVVVYDGAVNMGAGRSIRQLQDSCNGFPGRGCNLALDGQIGPKTEYAVRNICRETPALLLATAVLERRLAFYQGLARQSRFQPFLRGWKNRTGALLEYIREGL